MKRWIIWNLCPLACLGLAGYLAACGRDGWGWFLIVAVLLHVAPASARELAEVERIKKGLPPVD